MSDGAAIDFPFVHDLPKREKSKVGQAFDELAEFWEVSKQERGLVTVNHAMKALNITRTTIDILCAKGILRRYKFADHVLISVASIKERAEAERSVGGRPRKNK
jgi:hypothetical protein